MEIKRHVLDHKVLTELLIKHFDIHEGHWGIALEFVMGATLADPTGDGPCPTGMVSIRRIGIQEAKAGDALEVDASIVNPALKRRSPKKKSDQES